MRAPRVIAAVAFAALTAAGTAAASATGNTGSTDDGSAAAFTTCMREHGLQDFPDVTIDSDGNVHLDVTGTAIDPFSATYKKALDACESKLPAGSQLPAQPAAPGSPKAPATLNAENNCTPTTPKSPTSPS